MKTIDQAPASWHVEYFHHHQYAQAFGPVQRLYSQRSEYQLIEVVETPITGKMLLLDGKTMVSEADEFVYHELMAHISVMSHPKALSVLIIGGGDGGIIRELVKYPQLQRIDLIEIDRQVVEVSKEFLPFCTSGLSDPRVTIHAMDGKAYLENCRELYDIILVDSTDPEDFASSLFTEEFYGLVKKRLTPQGIMMAQTENPFLDCYHLANIYEQMRLHYPEVYSLSAPMLIYPGVYWSFALCGQVPQANQIKSAYQSWMAKELEPQLQWYNRQWHQGAFMLSNYHKKKIGQSL